MHPSVRLHLELLVAMAVGLIAAVGMYQAYVSFAASCDVQEQLIEQQQNLRIGMQKMVRDIRLAGYGREAGAGFSIIEPQRIEFTILDDATGVRRPIRYKFNADTTSDKKLDRSVDHRRPLSVIQNVEALDFVYLDSNRLQTTEPDAVRYVQIALVVKSANEDFVHTDRQSFCNLQNNTILTPKNDHFHRRLLTAEVSCRNMGF
jgi:type IV pilus assembly protein PilW